MNILDNNTNVITSAYIQQNPGGLTYIPVISELLDFGHSFIADLGAAMDRLLKDTGFQTLITAVALSAMVSVAVSGDKQSPGMFLSKYPVSLIAGLYISPSVSSWIGISPPTLTGNFMLDGVSAGVLGAPFSIVLGYLLGSLPR